MARIVVGVDGSDTSKAALRWAVTAATGLGAELDVVRAFRYPPALHDWTAVPSNYGFLPELPPEDVVERGAHDETADLVTAELGAEPAVKVTVRAERIERRPAEVLVDAAAGALMLVVGRSGHGGISDLLRVGSVARACVEHAPCPVVVVPVAS